MISSSHAGKLETLSSSSRVSASHLQFLEISTRFIIQFFKPSQSFFFFRKCLFQMIEGRWGWNLNRSSAFYSFAYLNEIIRNTDGVEDGVECFNILSYFFCHGVFATKAASVTAFSLSKEIKFLNQQN